MWRNAARAIKNPRLALAYARWLNTRSLPLPWGATVSGFRHFSEFWAVVNNIPTNDERRFVAQVLRQGGTALDIGANVGIYTSLLVHSGAHQVIAFEPLPTTAAILLENIRTLANVKVEALVLSDHAGFASFTADERSPQQNKLLLADTCAGTTVLPTDTIDSYCARTGIEHIALVKIDVEGAESLVLMGAQRMLREHRIGFVMLEVIPKALAEMKSSPEELADISRSCGYEILSLGGAPLSVLDLNAQSYQNVVLRPA